MRGMHGFLKSFTSQVVLQRMGAMQPAEGEAMTSPCSPRISELLASRICHDLVGPIGAIGNGVELMTEFGEDMGGDAMKLIASSAQQATRRLACFRLAYGAGGADIHVKLAQARDILAAFFEGSHTRLAWDENVAGLQDGIRQGFPKVVANAVLFAAECLNGAGEVEVSREGSGIIVKASGERAAFREGAEAALAQKTPPDALDVRLIQPFMTGAFALQYGIPLAWQWKDGALEIRISC